MQQLELIEADWYSPLRKILSLGSQDEGVAHQGELHAARQRHLGQFFTPDAIALFMRQFVSNFMPDRKVSILDNSVGSARLLQYAIPELTQRTRGISIEQLMERLKRYLTGWRGYFGFCETPSALQRLDEWVRRRVRCVFWKQWGNSPNRFRELTARGVGRDLAAQTVGSPHDAWRLSNSPALQRALTIRYLGSLGLPSLRI